MICEHEPPGQVIQASDRSSGGANRVELGPGLSGDSLDFERKYRSAVIAWAPDDGPIGEQIEAVLDEFEKTP